MTDIIFNRENINWQTGESPLFLGERLGLYDSINTSHPKLFELYKHQKSIDWSEDEINLENSRLDMLQAPPDLVDLMIDNLSYQWEIDSVASRSFAVLLAPFITNSEFWAATLKNQEIEVTHALTYSEINRQCIADPNRIFKAMAENEFIKERSVLPYKYLNNLAIAGAQYQLGLIKNDQNLFDTVFMAYIVMYLIERLQFMSSFSSSFITAENGIFRGICLLIQKIAIDELDVHSAVGNYAIRSLLKNDPRAISTLERKEKEIRNILKEFLHTEYAFNKKIFKNRKVLGLNADLNNSWAEYNLWFAEDTLGLTLQAKPKSPLMYMDNWLNIDKTQNANQESDNNNYKKIFVQETLSDNEVLDIVF